MAWQVELAFHLGCSRIVCLVDCESEPIDAVRRQARHKGLDFHVINGPLPLVGLLSADHELVVIADGLIADRTRLAELIGSGRGVITLPDEAGIAAGFERIDSRHAWGGVIVARAQIANQLAEMPRDSDTISLLLRLALQAGTPLVPLDPEAMEKGEWLLVRAPEAVQERESALLDSATEKVGWHAPGLALSRRFALALAPDALERGPSAGLVLGFAALFCALGLAAFGYSFTALLGLLAGSLALALSEALYSMKARLRGDVKRNPGKQFLRKGLDTAFVAVLALPLSTNTAIERLFLPLVLIGLLRIAESISRPEWQAVWSDRSLLALLLCIGAGIGVLDEASVCLSLFALAYCLLRVERSQITRA